MDIDSKKVFIALSVFLLLGLLFAIMLSFQVMKDTKSSIQPVASLPNQAEVQTRSTSIYDVNIDPSAIQVPATIATVPDSTQTPKRKPVSVPKENIKSYEQEQAELSAGLQQDYSTTTSQPRGSTQGVTPTLAEPAVVSEPSATPIESKSLQPTDKDIEDIEKKGLIIF